MSRYIVYSYEQAAGGGPFSQLHARQQVVGEFDDRAEADHAALAAVTVNGKAAGQVLRGTREVFWVDEEDVATLRADDAAGPT